LKVFEVSGTKAKYLQRKKHKNNKGFAQTHNETINLLLSIRTGGDLNKLSTPMRGDNKDEGTISHLS